MRGLLASVESCWRWRRRCLLSSETGAGRDWAWLADLDPGPASKDPGHVSEPQFPHEPSEGTKANAI